MKKSKSKLPSGLFYRKRSAVIWCWYYVKGSNQPTKESTGTTDTDEAKRFRAARLAEHPTARTERLTRQKVTTADALSSMRRTAPTTACSAMRGACRRFDTRSAPSRLSS